MEKNYGVELKERNVCPVCGGDQLVELNNDSMECLGCNYIDCSEEFYEVEIVPDGSEKCPQCGSTGKIKLSNLTADSGVIEVQCECGHINDIKAFVGEETWEEFIAKEKQRMQDELEEIKNKKSER